MLHRFQPNPCRPRSRIRCRRIFFPTPSFDKREAPAGVSYGEVVRPSSQDRVDLLDHPSYGLAHIALEDGLKLPQQCRSLLHLGHKPEDSLTIPRMALSIDFIRFVSFTNCDSSCSGLTFPLVGLFPTEYISLFSLDIRVEDLHLLAVEPFRHTNKTGDGCPSPASHCYLLDSKRLY